MSDNKELIYKQSELALAAYGVLAVGATKENENPVALVDAGFSRIQIQEFSSRYPTTVTTYSDSVSAQTARD